jgi:hypothetical protein
MKRALAAVVSTMLAVSVAAFAEEKHDHSAKAAKPDAPMAGMHEHMKKMRQQMAQIRAAQDPMERERLMNEHMKTMEDSMANMGGMMGCGKM